MSLRKYLREPWIEIRNAWVIKNKKAILKNINLRIDTNTVILGANGAGKTTLLRLIAGFEKPSKGQVIVCGYDTRYTPHEKLPVAIVFQNPNHHIFTQRVIDEITYGNEKIGKFASQLLHEMNLGGYEDVNPYMLSEGEKKRLALACAFAHRPKIVLIDEPTSGQDYRNIAQFIKIIKKKSETVLTIIVTHDINLAFAFERAIIMKNGEIYADGRIMEILANEKILENAHLIVPPGVKVINFLRNIGLHHLSKIVEMKMREAYGSSN